MEYDSVVPAHRMRYPADEAGSSRSLDKLYAYLLRQITLSNIKSDASALTVVLQILEDLRNTWMQVIEQEDGVRQRSTRSPDEVSR